MRIVTAYWCDERKILVYAGIKKKSLKPMTNALETDT